jgi:type IV secretion system protein VirB3
MALGVPYAALLANAFLTLELFLVTGNLLWLLTALPLHGLAWLVCLAEPRAFELIAVWGRVRSRAGFRGWRRWRAVSYGAFRPSGPHRDAQQPRPIIDCREYERCVSR